MVPYWIKKPDYDYEVWESDLSVAISEHYGVPYQLQQQDLMMDQDSVVDFQVNGSDDGVDGWPSVQECEEEIDRVLSTGLSIDDFDYPYQYQLFWHREHYIPIGIALWDMARKGKIPNGKYLVRVWW